MAIPVVHTVATIPKPAPDAGTGLFAATTIARGMNICFLPTSLVAVLDTARLADTCSSCFGSKSYQAQEIVMKNYGQLKTCSGCHVVKYCDKSCQSESWVSSHKYECGIYKALYPKILPINSRAVLRIVLLAETKKLGRQQDFQAFLKLESHYKNIIGSNREQVERIMLSSQAVHAYSKTNLSIRTISAFFAKLEVNSFNLTTAFYDRIGLCLQPYAALINHSCIPNAIVGFDGQATAVKALRDIEQGEQIFISYIDNTNPYEKRQKELVERYFFKCDCPKCMQGANAREDLFLMPMTNISALIDAEIEALEFLTSPGCDEGSGKVFKVKSAISILNKTRVWPVTRQPYPQFRDELIVALLEAQQFQAAFLQSVIRYLYVDPVLFPDSWHPIREVHAWVLAKLALYLSQDVNLASEAVDLHRYDLNLGLIAYSLVENLCRCHDTLPSVHKMLEAKYKEICDEFEAKGLKPASMKKETEAEWEKMEKLADEALRLETKDGT